MPTDGDLGLQYPKPVGMPKAQWYSQRKAAKKKNKQQKLSRRINRR